MTTTTWIDEAEHRAEAATPGPWEVWSSQPTVLVQKTYAGANKVVADVNSWHHGINEAEFIAAARTDVPRLCKALRMLLESEQANYCDCSDYNHDGKYSNKCTRSIAERIHNGDF